MNGIGLGLFICKRICESFDGEIELRESEENVGTSFQFRILTQGSSSERDSKVVVAPLE